MGCWERTEGKRKRDRERGKRREGGNTQLRSESEVRSPSILRVYCLTSHKVHFKTRSQNGSLENKKGGVGVGVNLQHWSRRPGKPKWNLGQLFFFLFCCTKNLTISNKEISQKWFGLTALETSV